MLLTFWWLQILSPGGDPDEADASVVRIVLALSSFANLHCHIVAELCDVDNLDIVRLAMHGEVSVAPIVAHDVIGRVMIQCSRQVGVRVSCSVCCEQGAPSSRVWRKYLNIYLPLTKMR